MEEEKRNPKSRGLGRGLSALFEDDEDVLPQSGVDEGAGKESASSVLGSKRDYLPIESLTPGQYQPRKEFTPGAIEELAESIAKHGVLQPLLVRKLAEETASGAQYEIIAGERRWRASQKAGIYEVPVVIKNFDDATTLEVALIENLQREDLNPLEEADAYKQLMEEFDHTQESLAASLGKSRPHIANTMRLLNLPDGVKAYVLAGKITAGHARALLGSEDPEGLAEQIVGSDLSVREAEKLAKSGKPTSKSKAKAAAKDVDTLALEEEMSSRLGTKVEITIGKKGGKLIVHYGDFDQLDDFLHRLSKKA